MLSDDKLAGIVQDFYALVLQTEDAFRLEAGTLGDQAYDARVIAQQDWTRGLKRELGRGSLGAAELAAAAMIRRHSLELNVFE